MNNTQKYISWFSCGAASATATYLALREYGKENVRVFLDELDPKAGHLLSEPDIQCGIICMSEQD